MTHLEELHLDKRYHEVSLAEATKMVLEYTQQQEQAKLAISRWLGNVNVHTLRVAEIEKKIADILNPS